MISKAKKKTASSFLKSSERFSNLPSFLLCRRKNSGSILLEIAIGLSVIGIISGFFMSRSIIANKAIKLQKTRANIEKVVAALASYLSENKRLPRPSIDNNGVESEYDNYAVGKIPYRTLGLSEKDAIDGDAKSLIYVVEPILTNCRTIYEGSAMDDGRFNFCRNIALTDQKIEIKNNQKSGIGEVVIFVVDTSDNPPQIGEDKIVITQSSNTVWMRRDLFLIQYLKLMPCAAHREMSGQNVKDTQNQVKQTSYNPFDDF
jgi:hypothetical protein